MKTVPTHGTWTLCKSLIPWLNTQWSWSEWNCVLRPKGITRLSSLSSCVSTSFLLIRVENSAFSSSNWSNYKWWHFVLLILMFQNLVSIREVPPGQISEYATYCSQNRCSVEHLTCMYGNGGKELSSSIHSLRMAFSLLSAAMLWSILDLLTLPSEMNMDKYNISAGLTLCGAN